MPQFLSIAARIWRSLATATSIASPVEKRSVSTASRSSGLVIATDSVRPLSDTGQTSFSRASSCGTSSTTFIGTSMVSRS